MTYERKNVYVKETVLATLLGSLAGGLEFRVESVDGNVQERMASQDRKSQKLKAKSRKQEVRTIYRKA